MASLRKFQKGIPHLSLKVSVQSIRGQLELTASKTFYPANLTILVIPGYNSKYKLLQSHFQIICPSTSLTQSSIFLSYLTLLQCPLECLSLIKKKQKTQNPYFTSWFWLNPRSEDSLSQPLYPTFKDGFAYFTDSYIDCVSRLVSLPIQFGSCHPTR